MHRYELTDEQWGLIEELLPKNSGPGRPWEEHRRVLNGMFWVLHSGAPWRDVPERYGPWQTVYERFSRWQQDGTLDRMLERLRMRLDAEGRIDWDLWCVDGTNIRAHKAAAGAEKKGGLPRSPRTTRWAAREAGGDRSSTWSLTVAALPSRSR